MTISVEVVSSRISIECSIIHEQPNNYYPLLDKNGNELLTSEDKKLNAKIE